MKVKIQGRWANLPSTDKDEYVYDIYYGSTGLLPFCTKWKIEKAGLTKDELTEWFANVMWGYPEIIMKF